MKKVLKFLGIIVLLVIVTIILAFVFISPIVKYVVEKNCMKWTGREITIGKIDLRLTNGSIYIRDLKVYEENKDSIFFNCHSIYLKVDLKKMLHKEYVVDTIRLKNPQIRITQDGKKFNFDDLVKRFSPPPGAKPDPTKSPDTHYYIGRILIIGGNITYTNIPIHNVFRIHDLNLNVPELDWDKPQINAHLDFNYGIGGFFNIDLDANRKTLAYTLYCSVDKYDLSQYYTPVRTALKISSLKGLLSTKLRIHGNFNNPDNTSVHGYLNLYDVELRDPAKKKFLALGELSLDVDSVDVKHNHFDVNHFIITRPYVVFDQSDKGSNFSQMVVKHAGKSAVNDTGGKAPTIDYSNIATLIGSGAKVFAANFLKANYHADSIIINNGEFVFNDVTPKHEFQYKVSKFNLVTNEVDDYNSGVLFTASATLGDTGKLTVKANLKYDFKHKLFSYALETLKITDISPVVKYLLEKNSVKWTGRRITTGLVKLNAVKGSLFIKDIKIYEPDSTSVFFACHDVYLRVNFKKMLDNTYQVEKAKIDNPEISIIQNGNNFNFDDLAKRFAPGPSKQADSNSPQIHYVVDSVLINHGNITYNNVPIHNVFKIHDLNFFLPEIRWDNPVSNIHLDFNYGIGGFFNINFNVNRNTLAYNLSLGIDNYDLSQYYAPLDAYMNISSLNGMLNSKLMVHGRFDSPKDVSASGYIHIDDFAIQDMAKKKLFSLGKLVLDIDTINVKQNMYYLHRVLLDKPYMVFDYYTKGNNISNIIKYTAPAAPAQSNPGEIKTDYSNIFTLLSSSLSLMASNFVNSSYGADSMIIRNGEFQYNDYTLNDPFHYNISKINIVTDKINQKTKSIQFNALAKLNDTGKFKMNADISLNLKNMLLQYEITDLRVADFNPYSEYYIATSFLNGYMNYHSVDSVINRELKSSNVIHIEGMKTSVSTDNKPIYKVPVHMALSLLKDEKGNIDIKIPATGNLDDPNYKLGPLVGHIMTDFMVKTATQPFKALAKLFKDKKPEELKQFNFEYNDELAEEQFSKLDDVFKVLSKKKELNVELTQVIDSVEEKDELALTRAKKQYYDATHNIANDSMQSKKKQKEETSAEDKIATQDSLFNKYLDDKLHLMGNDLMSVQDKCIKLLGDSLLSETVHKEILHRNEQVTEYLITKKGLPARRVKVTINKDPIKTRDTIEPEFDINYTVE